MEDLSSLREEIKQLHDRTQNTKSDVRVLQTKFDERHVALMEKIEKINSDVEKLTTRLDHETTLIVKKLNDLNDLANKGKTSLKTIWFIGGLVAACLATLATWLDIFK